MIQPTLTLNFARTGQLGRRVNFSRSSTGVYTGYDGILKYAGIDEPRFDYDASGNSLGLLIEEQRTNLIIYSQAFGLGNKYGATVTDDAAVAPDGTLTADKLIESTEDRDHGVSRSAHVVAGTYTESIYLKAAGRDYAYLWLDNGSGVTNTLRVNLTSGDFAFTKLSEDVYSDISASVSAVGGGWWRASITSTTPYTFVAIRIYCGDFYDSDLNYGTPLYTGDGTSGIYLWGAQLESGATPSSYTSTTTATVTRTADAAELSGDPFASWINTEGTLLAKYKNAGWLYNDTPPTDSLDLTKYIDDYSTSAAGDTIERVIFYPRTLTAAQRGRIMI
jgi:hypothetical protein